MRDYPMISGAGEECKAVEPEPVDVRLKRRLLNVQKEATDLEAAIKALEAQPQLLETLNLLRRVGI